MTTEQEKTNLIKNGIRAKSNFNVTHIREIVLHFQALKSARASRFMMDAPGLYFPDLQLYVISKSGSARGHATLLKSILPVIPKDKKLAFGFVLYPESYVRSCLDRILRKSTVKITREMRISMENVFNKKHHGKNLTASNVEKDIIFLLKKDLEHNK